MHSVTDNAQVASSGGTGHPNTCHIKAATVALLLRRVLLAPPHWNHDKRPTERVLSHAQSGVNTAASQPARQTHHLLCRERHTPHVTDAIQRIAQMDWVQVKQTHHTTNTPLQENIAEPNYGAVTSHAVTGRPATTLLCAHSSLLPCRLATAGATSEEVTAAAAAAATVLVAGLLPTQSRGQTPGTRSRGSRSQSTPRQSCLSRCPTGSATRCAWPAPSSAPA